MRTTRTARHIAIYYGFLLGLPLAVLGIGLGLSAFLGNLTIPIAVLAVILFRPHQLILRYFRRDLITGLRLLRIKDYAAAKVRLERFIGTMRRAPWLKSLIWLRKATNLGDPEALALINLGLAATALKEFDLARTHFEEAIALNDGNPLPYYHLGILCFATAEIQDAVTWFEKARAHGFGDDASDKIINGIAALSDVPPASGPFGIEILNDDVTPMEFVVDLLREEFDCTEARATGIMLTVHGQGSGLCGRYGEVEARARMGRAAARAQAAHHPLTFRIVGPGLDELGAR